MAEEVHVKVRVFGSLALVVLAAVAVAVASIAASAGGTAEGPWKGTGTLQGNGSTIVLFLPTAALKYNARYIIGVKQEAAKYGYKVKSFQNNYDQAAQDQQVQQWLASGQEAAGFILYPPAALASRNSARLLGRVAPVVQGATAPANNPAGYAGTSHLQTGQLMFKAYQRLLADLKAKNVKLKAPGGAVLFVVCPKIITVCYSVRKDGFMAAAKKAGVAVKDVGTIADVVDRESGFKQVSAALPKYAGKFDIVWVLNKTGAEGTALALRQQGLHPGKDVWLVSAGDCTGGLKKVADGTIYSTVGQSGTIEAKAATRTLLRLISSGHYDPGVEILPATRDEPPLTNTPPKKTTISPQVPIVGASDIGKVKLWGETAAQMCPE
jgi:ABC-type sugar transport system substrate-binding protein